MIIFSTCKPFTGSVAIRQYNALQTWAGLEPNPGILFGDDQGTEQAAYDFAFEYVPDAERNEHGILVPGLIEAAEQRAQPGQVLVMVDADILMPPSVEHAIFVARTQFERFLIIGHRREIDGPLSLDLSKGWDMRLLSRSRTFSPDAIDYFIFTPGIWPNVPPFVVGRYGYDNWLVWDAIRRGIPTIDATATIYAYHQKHQRQPRSGKDWETNLSFMPRRGIGWVTHAPWILNANGTITRRR